MTQTILVTGAQGFTGQYLCDALRQKGHHVIGLSQIPTDDHHMVTCDLTDRNQLQETIKNIKPDKVAHLAALSFVANDNAEAFYQVNVVGTCNLLDALKKAPPKQILIASSANIYGQPSDGKPISESYIPAPVNHYGASKLAMEHMARTYQDTLPIIITRPFNYTGPGQAEHFLIPKIVTHFAKKAPEIALGNLDVSRDFTSIHDLIQAYIKILDSDVSGETFNVCSGKAISLQQILHLLEEISGHSIQVKVNPAFVRSNEIKLLLGDHSHLTELTGWQPEQSFKNMLEEMLRIKS
jgi:nucleoside-diphosphate-sugar epimerase